MILCLTVAIFSAKGWVVAGDKNEIAEHNFRLAVRGYLDYYSFLCV